MKDSGLACWDHIPNDSAQGLHARYWPSKSWWQTRSGKGAPNYVHLGRFMYAQYTDPFRSDAGLPTDPILSPALLGLNSATNSRRPKAAQSQSCSAELLFGSCACAVHTARQTRYKLAIGTGLGLSSCSLNWLILIFEPDFLSQDECSNRSKCFQSGGGWCPRWCDPFHLRGVTGPLPNCS